jgi:hypothetical protein
MQARIQRQPKNHTESFAFLLTGSVPWACAQDVFQRSRKSLGVSFTQIRIYLGVLWCASTAKRTYELKGVHHAN